MNISPSKIRVVYLAASLDIAPTASSIFDFPYILYVGQRRGYKNFISLAKAFASSNILKSNFTILAFGGESLSKIDYDELKSLKIADRVVFKRGSDAELRRAYMDASVFVYPSLYEGFGIPPLEAMIVGCPSIVANTSSIPEVVGGASLYFDPTDIDQLRTAMELSLSDSVIRESLVQKGYLQSKCFSWKTCADETVKIYENIVS